MEVTAAMRPQPESLRQFPLLPQARMARTMSGLALDLTYQRVR